MPNNKVEDQLRKRLRQHPTPVDVDALWDQVEPRLPNKKRRVLPFWFWFVTGITLFGLLFLLPDGGNNHQVPFASQVPEQPPYTETHAPVPVESTTTPAPASSIVTTDDAAINDPVLKPSPEVNKSYPVQPAKPKPPPSGIEKTPRIYAETKTIGPEENTSHPPLSSDPSSVSEDAIQSESPLPLAAVGPGLDVAISTVKETITATDKKAEQDFRSKSVDSNRKAEERETNEWETKRNADLENSEATENTPLTAEMKARYAETMAGQLKEQEEDGQQAEGVNALHKAEELPTGVLTTQKPEHSQADSDNEAEGIKPKFGQSKKPSYWTVEPGVALSLSRNSNSGEDGPGSEDALEGISLQGMIGYHRASGLSIRTGLIMSRINSKLEAEIDRPGSQPQETVINIIENTNGVTTQQLGIVQLAIIETTTSRFYNSVTSMDIPMLIGYRFSGNKWGLLVETGPTFNLSSGGEAHRYNGTGFAAVGDNYFRKKLQGQGFLFHFGGTYRLTEKTALSANLRFQSFGNGGFENPDVSSYSTNYSLFGVQIGYRIRF